MLIPTFQVNAFTSQAFSGNPALVCVLPTWLHSEVMQKVAKESGLTVAFLMTGDPRYQLRWFAPKAEIKGICGHATLAAAFVAFNQLGDPAKELCFDVEAGELRVRRDGKNFVLDLPALNPTRIRLPENAREVFGCEPEETLSALDFLAVLPSERNVVEFEPDAARLLALPNRATIVTARGGEVDFVSRWFGPRHGKIEDQGFTGSAHCSLVPYWAHRLGKTQLKARQLSARGTTINCELHGDRVWMFCSACLYLEGALRL